MNVYRYLSALTLLAAPLVAQSNGQKITFDEAIGIALRQNGTLRQAENAAAQSSTVVTSRKMAMLPSLNLSTSTAANVGRTFDQSEGRVVDQATQSLNAGLSSSFTVFDGFKNVSQLHEA